MRGVDKDTGFLHLLVVVDHLSKYVWAQGFPTTAMDPVADYLRKMFETLKPPTLLASDNGGSFRGSAVAKLCDEFGVKQVFGRALHPQSQGAVENKS